VKITRIRNHQDGILVGLDGYQTPELAGKFRNQALCILSLPSTLLEKGEYYHHDLIGLNVLDEAKHHLGQLDRIIETGANDVYVVVEKSGKEILLPAIPDVIKKIDLIELKMVVHLLPGLIDEE
jgi:16S rRNA processing protein RimM